MQRECAIGGGMSGDIGEMDWEAFAAHLRANGEEAALDHYPEYWEWLKKHRPDQEQADAPRGKVVREYDRDGVHVIEREVVVVRCRECKALTPEGAEKCSGCGADL